MNFSKISMYCIGILSALFILSCASIPPEAVELSTAVESRITETKSMHQSLVRSYFDARYALVDDYMYNEYVDDYIENIFNNPAIHEAWNEIRTGENEEDRNMFFRVVTLRLFQNVQDQRKQLISPIQERENELLQALDQYYGDTLAAHRYITDLLASAADLNATRNELFADIVGETPDFSGIIDQINRASNTLRAGGESAEEALNKTLEIIQ